MKINTSWITRRGVMGPAEMSRWTYRGIYWAICILIVRPAAVFFVILLLGMLIAKTGPAGLAEDTLRGMEDLYRHGPAEAGYLNVTICADAAEIQAQEPVERSETPLAPVKCKRKEVTTVAIGEAAREAGGMMVWAYALALIIGNVAGALSPPLRTSKRPKG